MASVGRVGVEVAAEFASQIGGRGEDAAGHDFALDFGEPQFDLAEPARMGGREVKLHMRMLLEEMAKQLRFMSGEVVEDDMNLLPGRAQRHHFFQGRPRSRGWCGEPQFFRGRGWSWYPARHAEKACRVGSTRSHDAQRGPRRAAEPGRVDPEPELQFFHRPRTRPRVWNRRWAVCVWPTESEPATSSSELWPGPG